MNYISISECRNSARLIIPLQLLLKFTACYLFLYENHGLNIKKSTYFNFMVDLEWYGSDERSTSNTSKKNVELAWKPAT